MPTGGDWRFLRVVVAAHGWRTYRIFSPRLAASHHHSCSARGRSDRALTLVRKFIGQLATCPGICNLGGRIEFVSNPFGGMFYLGYLSMPVTVLWILALINLMNFIDGLDGLAVGITLIAALTLLSLAWDLGRMEAAVLSAILVGVSAGFLPFNFNPAKLYLGDAGAMLLGLLLAVVSTEGALKGAATIGLSVPILIFALPIVDTFCAVVRRIQQGVPFYQADQSHFHHRMLQLGLTQRQVVFVAYFLSSLSACAALFAARMLGQLTSWCL